MEVRNGHNIQQLVFPRGHPPWYSSADFSLRTAEQIPAEAASDANLRVAGIADARFLESVSTVLSCGTEVAPPY